MTTMISELYTALRKAGVDDDTARAAAKAVIAVEDKEQLATKADLVELKADLTWRILLAMAFLTTVYGAMLAVAARYLRP